MQKSPQIIQVYSDCWWVLHIVLVAKVHSLVLQFTDIKWWCITNWYIGFEPVNNYSGGVWHECSFVTNKSKFQPFQSQLKIHWSTITLQNCWKQTKKQSWLCSTKDVVQEYHAGLQQLQNEFINGYYIQGEKNAEGWWHCWSSWESYFFGWAQGNKLTYSY